MEFDLKKALEAEPQDGCFASASEADEQLQDELKFVFGSIKPKRKKG